MSRMKVLVLGSGGREHALVWKLRQSPHVEQVYCVPGNAGIADEATLERGDILCPAEMAELALRLGADLTVVGPEAPLVAGVVDEFQARGLRTLGPTRAAARLEGSKIFAKQFVERQGIPTAEFVVCEHLQDARQHLARFGFPVVLKADGLAAGKGVVVAADARQAELTLEGMLSGELVGKAGRCLVLERFLSGEEVTFTVVTDGETALALAPTQDHKPVFDNDQGPNTGGMGAYCEDAILSETLRQRILDEIVQPTLAGMAAEGTPYCGILYFGLMITAEGPCLLEYNARFGDPETQPLVMRLTSDLVPVLEAAAGGGLAAIRPEWSAGATVCVVATSGGYPGEFARDKPIAGLSEAAALPSVKVFHAGTRLCDGQYVTAGGRVLSVTASGSDLREAISRAYAAVEKIHFEGIHYRRDIGRKRLIRTPA